MVTIFDVAKYILIETGSMSQWKLQKLCYYSQAWHIAWGGEPLFAENFEAWTNGPVCPALRKICEMKFPIRETDVHGDAEKLSEYERDSINIVIGNYGEFDLYQLREISRNEKPWINAAEEGGIITKEAMKEFYSKKTFEYD